jgi:formiminotetrahydrofolate cyclodeaminase
MPLAKSGIKIGYKMNTSTTIKNYLDEVSSNSPTPGGGNVSAFCGALACSLGMMVCNLTIGKKKYAEVGNEIKEILIKLESYKNDFLKLADEDNKAFEQVMAAFRLPKETEEEKKTRSAGIEEATIQAAVIPSNVIEACRLVIPLMKTVASKGNRNSASDAGVGAILLKTASEGAYLNVMTNCSSLSNKTYAAEFLKKSEVAFNEVEIQAEKILADIKNSLVKI